MLLVHGRTAKATFSSNYLFFRVWLLQIIFDQEVLLIEVSRFLELNPEHLGEELTFLNRPPQRQTHQQKYKNNRITINT